MEIADKELWVVADDLTICDLLGSFLVGRGYRAVTVVSAEEAVRRYQTERPAAVLLDLMMPGAMDGLDALAAFRKIDRTVPVIVVSGEVRTATVVQAIKLGAADFVRKPFEVQELEVPLANALEQRQRSCAVASMRDQIQAQSNQQMLFGNSEPMAEVWKMIERVADTDVTVHIHGESGTGKDLVARALWTSSLRREMPFVKANCATRPTELLDSELFGFERGAFTGAIRPKPGKIEFANTGTLFIDEIGEMSPPLQAKLLQLLQDGQFLRRGGQHTVRVDVRIIAATNRDLHKAVLEGQFREDLLVRLNAVAIRLPPLRQRCEEIPLLTEYFLKKYSVQHHKSRPEISEDTMRLFMEYNWPGNVRELEKLIEHAVVLGDEAAIRTEMTQRLARAAQRAASAAAAAPLPASLEPVEAPSATCAPARPTGNAAAESGHYKLKDISRAAAREAERELILKMLQQTQWNRRKTAERLGISYKALLYKIREGGLDKAP